MTFLMCSRWSVSGLQKLPTLLIDSTALERADRVVPMCIEDKNCNYLASVCGVTSDNWKLAAISQVPWAVRQSMITKRDNKE